MRSHVLASLGDYLNPQELLNKFGTIGLFLIIFAESGLLIGFFLPGDSLLFTAGLLSAGGKLAPLPVLLVGCFLAAFLGDQVGYMFGKKVGPSIFSRPDSRLFKVEYVEKAQSYFDKHGSKTIILARFVPVVRTFAPIVAGVGKMHYRTFVSFNVIGALIWACGVTTLGYLLGDRIGPEKIDKYLLPIIAVIIVLSLIPVAIEYYRHRRQATRAATADEAA
ncbi:MAG: VTT domain-containing protein [Acidimicrobiales bacterium]